MVAERLGQAVGEWGKRRSGEKYKSHTTGLQRNGCLPWGNRAAASSADQRRAQAHVFGHIQACRLDVYREMQTDVQTNKQTDKEAQAYKQ
ncbi:unnamed protein product [Protopolystoma xenopodis]|uniref:Uncharacterized protein n=1 Tax=Protopolystoma xenopodis TaxID=117903 RepID=A0A3S5BVU1_9PLAT|nr:unnamed protein product [Protopolystoma xenopodis]